MDQNLITNAWTLINKSNRITLLTHLRPDPDGISACCAMEHVLHKLNKSVETIYPSKPDSQITKHPNTFLVNTHSQIPDLIIAFDTANYERLYYPTEFKPVPFINVDHHVSNSINASINLIEPKASSTCEILYNLLKIWNPKLIDTYIAECLLLGIIYDTQVFQTNATYVSTLEAAAELMNKGAKLFELKEELLANKNPNIIKLWGEILSNVKISSNKKAAWVVMTQALFKKYNLEQSAISGLSNFLSQIAGIDVIATICETEDYQFKISLRSKKTDVNAIAKLFGGGGHINASGVCIKKPLPELESELTKIFEKI